MKGLFIDPGDQVSGWIIFDGHQCYERDISLNKDVLGIIRAVNWYEYLVVEVPRSQGKPRFSGVSNTLYDTLFWSGRFVQEAIHNEKKYLTVNRKDVMHFICHSMSSNDRLIIAAIKEKFGEESTPLFKNNVYNEFKYGKIWEDIWQALAIGIYFTGCGAIHRLKSE